MSEVAGAAITFGTLNEIKICDLNTYFSGFNALRPLRGTTTKLCVHGPWWICVSGVTEGRIQKGIFGFVFVLCRLEKVPAFDEVHRKRSDDWAGRRHRDI